MEPFLGEIVMFGGNFAPRSWAFCHGQLLAIASNTALFSILGTTYGGDGRTSFALPDLRGAVAVGEGQRPGQPTNFRLGQKGGADTTTLITQNLPAHSHGLFASSNNADAKNPANGFLPSYPRGATEFYYSSAIGTAQAMGTSVGNTGNNQSFNNLQPYTTVNYIICTQGLFPSRN